MTGGVRTFVVTADESDVRLDRWFKRHFPSLGHGRLEKLLRTGQVRVDGRRVKAAVRLVTGQQVRVPPIVPAASPLQGDPRPAVTPDEAGELRARILHMDDDVIAIDKPAGLAVQGGRKVERNLDAMLDALRFDAAERPRLVHRLDKDTSGVLLLGRNARAAARLASAFRERAARKIYWAAVVGIPDLRRGRIDLALAKVPGPRGERVGPNAGGGKRAVTLYAVVDDAAERVTWLGLMPLTGRGHQLRAHCVALGTPILGDGKYGGAGAFIAAEDVARQLHLHARSITLPHPRAGTIVVDAPLPAHMAATWRYFGFDASTWAEISPLFEAA